MNNATYIGHHPSRTCKYLESKESHDRTTIYPHCACGMKKCKEFEGYCPIRDDRD